MHKKQKRKRSLEERLATYFVDSTAIQLITIPVKTGLDMIIGYPIHTSITEKIWSIGGTYMVGGPISSQARDTGTKKLHMDENTPEWKRIAYDAALFGTLHAILTVGMYGAASLKEKTGFDINTIMQTAGFHFLTYIPTSVGISYSIDFFRAVTGIGNTPRFKKIKKYSANKKKALGFGVLGGLLGVAVSTYALYPKKTKTPADKKEHSIIIKPQLPANEINLIKSHKENTKTIQWYNAQKMLKTYQEENE